MHSPLSPLRALKRSPLRRAFSVVGAALGVVVWLAFAPAALGGSSTYVTTYGVSMEPTLHKGDLAIVRPQSSYAVGDIVAYRSETLHTVVLHRIIGRDGERYVFKGDNNTWVDTDHPTAAQLVGKMDVKLPGFGARVQQVASPPGIAALATFAALPAAKGKRRKARKGGADGAPSTPARRGLPSLRHVDPKMLVFTAVAVGLLAFAFTRPTTTQTTSDLPFDDRGTFTYTGPAPGAGSVYQGDQVASGQPIFFNLVDHLDMGFTYSASALSPLVATGDVYLTGMIMDSDGWSYPFEIAPKTPFEGTDVTTSGTVDLKMLQSTIAAMEASTGVKRDTYTVLVKATVNRELRRKDVTTAGVFATSLEFKLDDLEMHLATPGGTALTPTQGGLLSIPVERENTITLLGQSASVAAVRAAALALALITFAVWIDWLVRAARSDESSLIERRYRTYLLPVRTGMPASELVIDVESITALARIADHTGAPMLHGEPGVYHVVDGTRVYRYQVAALEAVHAEVPAPAEPVLATAVPARRRERPLRADRGA
jgi:signal peptidase I